MTNHQWTETEVRNLIRAMWDARAAHNRNPVPALRADRDRAERAVKHAQLVYHRQSGVWVSSAPDSATGHVPRRPGDGRSDPRVRSSSEALARALSMWKSGGQTNDRVRAEWPAFADALDEAVLSE